MPCQARCRCLVSALKDAGGDCNKPLSYNRSFGAAALNPRRNVVLTGRPPPRWVLPRLPRVGGHKALERRGKKAFLAQAAAAQHGGGDGEAASS